MIRSSIVLAGTIWVSLVAVVPQGLAQSLKGSQISLERQNFQAKRHDFTYLRESAQLRRFVEAGILVPVEAGESHVLGDVSFPFARPEVRLFVERLSVQYHEACGEQLVVTSLTRPVAHQPPNAARNSVHPTGMALDLRRPRNSACRGWLDETLLYLENRKVLEATLEREPPHYHVAVFPRPYRDYVAALIGGHRAKVSLLAEPSSTYRVRRRDTLWKISRQFSTTPGALRRINSLNSSLIYPGQVLAIPKSTD